MRKITTFKKLSYAIAGIMALFISVTFTSCLSSDSESSWDYSLYITQESYTNVYVSDDGYRFSISNILTHFTEYPERAYVYLKLADGEVLTKDRTISATIYEGNKVTPMPFLYEVDEDNTYVINSFYQNTSSNIYNWTAQGYLNLMFRFYVKDQSSTLSFGLVPVSAENDKLTVQLVQTDGGVKAGENYYTEAYGVGCFKLPTSLTEIQTALTNNDGSTLTPTNDSIYIKVVATNYNDAEIKLNESFRVKIGN